MKFNIFPIKVEDHLGMRETYGEVHCCIQHGTNPCTYSFNFPSFIMQQQYLTKKEAEDLSKCTIK